MTPGEKWSGWVDIAYEPPRKITMHEYGHEIERGFSVLPGTWQYSPDGMFCDYCDSELDECGKCPNCGYAGLG